MSTQVKKVCVLKTLLLSIFCNIVFFSSSSFSQDAKLIEVSNWGSGIYTSTTLHNGLMYHSIANSSVVDVQSLDPSQKNRLLGQVNLMEDITHLDSCNGYLVADSGFRLAFYNVDNLSEPELSYSLDVIDRGFNTLLCDGETIVYLDGNQRLYLITYTDNTFTLNDVYQAQLLDENQEIYVQSAAMSLESGKLVLAYYTIDPALSQVDTFNTIEFTLENGTFNEPIAKTLETNINVFSELAYAHSGRFFLKDNDATLYILDTSGDELSLGAPRTIGSGFASSQVSYHNKQLWVIDELKTLRIYDLTEFVQIPELSSTIVLGDDLSRWRLKDSLFLDGRFYVRHVQGFGEIIADGNGYAFSPLYYQAGSAGTPIVVADKAYLPRGGRVDVLNIADIQNPVLEQQIAVDENDEFSALFTTENTLIYAGLFYRIKTGDLSEGPDFDDLFTTTIPESGKVVGRKVIEDSLFAYSRESKLFYRYNVSNSFSLLESYETFDLDLPSDGYNTVEAIEALQNTIFVLFGFPEPLLMFTNSADPSNAQAEFVLSDDPSLPVVDIASNDEYLFVLDYNEVSTYQLDESRQLSKVASLDLNEFASASSFVASMTVVENFLILSEFTSGSGNLSIMYAIGENGALEYISSTEFGNDAFITPRSEFIKANDYYIVDTYDNSYAFIQVNLGPKFTENSFTGEEDSSVSISLANADPEGDELSIEVLEASSNGEFSFNEQEKILTFTPSANFFGETDATLKLSDEHGSSSVSTLSFSISNVNDAPELISNAIELDEDTLLTLQLEAIDIDSESISFALESQAEFGTASLSESGELSYQGEQDYAGSDTFDVKVSDTENAESIYTIAVTVLPINDLPVYTGDSQVNANEDTIIAFTLDANDVEADSITYTVTSVPEGWDYVLDAGQLSLTPKENDNGEFTVGLQLDDGSGSIEQSLSVNLASVNDIPVAARNSISQSVTAGKTVTTSLSVTDVEDSVLSYTITRAPTAGSASVSSSGVISYSANKGKGGSDIVTVEVSDSSGASTAIDVTYSIAPRKKSGGTLSFSLLGAFVLCYMLRFKLKQA